MKNQELQATLAEIAEQAAPSTEIDLWKKMWPHLVTSESTLKKGDAAMKTSLFRTALILVAVIVALATLFSTPQGQAFAKNLLQFFTRTPGDSIPVPTQSQRWVDPNAPQTALTPLASPTGFAFADDCGKPPGFKCSMEQIRSKVGFTVMELGSIPSGLYFIGATGGPQRIVILYDSADHSGALSLIEEPWTGRPEQIAWQVGASAVVETVQIGNVTGEYVKGSYIYMGGDTNAVWDATLASQSLHWVKDGVFFQMSADGPQVDKTSFIALAQNLTSQPVSAGSPVRPTETPETDIAYASPFTLTIREAEKQAGFTIQGPDALPESLPFQGAMFDEQEKIVYIEYQRAEYKSLGIQNGLTLSQQMAPNPNDCKLCGISTGDNKAMDQDRFHMIVSPESNLETVQIGTVTGQYVEGHWIGSDCCGWIWTAEDIKTLRWWKDGKAFELMEVGAEITRADIIKIAESIQ